MAQARFANASFWDVITVTPRLYEVIWNQGCLFSLLTSSRPQQTFDQQFPPMGR